jgi:hypothetical protein
VEKYPDPSIQGKEPPQIDVTVQISMEDFPSLEMEFSKFEELSDKEKKMRLDIDKAKINYKVARGNFDDVLNIKTLIENISDKKECYSAYYRIKDLNKKIEVSSSSSKNIAVLNEIKDPLTAFLKNCSNLRVDLLEKYGDEKYGNKKDGDKKDGNK